MEVKDYYAILGVAEDADAKAIKSAYRKLARKYHPDVSKEKDAEAKFKEVGEAYAVLGDEQKRAEYDQLCRYRPQSGGQGGGAGQPFNEQDFASFFENLFGAGRGAGGGFHRSGFDSEGFNLGPRPGEEGERDLPLFLEEIISNQQKDVSFTLRTLDEQGQLRDIEKTLKVRIPRGVTAGERIRVKGQGGPGFNGGPNGDLYLKIRFAPHPLFDVDGHNLILTLPVAPWEAALGTKVEVPTLQGHVQLIIPANSHSGARLRLKGKGLPGRYQDGDLYTNLKIMLPERPAQGDEALWQQLAEHHRHFNPREKLR